MQFCLFYIIIFINDKNLYWLYIVLNIHRIAFEPAKAKKKKKKRWSPAPGPQTSVVACPFFFLDACFIRLFASQIAKISQQLQGKSIKKREYSRKAIQGSLSARCSA